MKKIKSALFFSMIISLVFSSCTSQTIDKPVQPINNFAKGADVGWLPQMEATGYKFYDTDGKQKDCLQLLKDRGMNTIRLRVWVNPSNDKASGHCSPAETVTMGVRAKKMGMRIMIDFHYSDSWADPAKQNKPEAWKNHSFPELLNDVYNHTFDVISALKINHQSVLDFIEEIPRLKQNYFYDDGKWTVKQVINHIVDTERILGYRALRFARGDNQQPLSFDENLYAKNANLSNTNMQMLVDEFDSIINLALKAETKFCDSIGPSNFCFFSLNGETPISPTLKKRGFSFIFLKEFISVLLRFFDVPKK